MNKILYRPEDFEYEEDYLIQYECDDCGYITDSDSELEQTFCAKC